MRSISLILLLLLSHGSFAIGGQLKCDGPLPMAFQFSAGNARMNFGVETATPAYRIADLKVELRPSEKGGKKPLTQPRMLNPDASMRIWEQNGKITGTQEEGGNASCTFTVDEDGRVASVVDWKDAAMLSHDSRVHLASCIKLSHWEPAMKGKKPAACVVQLTFTFVPQ